LSEPPAGKAEGQTPTVKEVIARVQRLCDTPRPEGGYPLATSVQGYFLGDITAIVAATIRSERLLEH
jgi:hypothetical protein